MRCGNNLRIHDADEPIAVLRVDPAARCEDVQQDADYDLLRRHPRPSIARRMARIVQISSFSSVSVMFPVSGCAFAFCRDNISFRMAFMLIG
jgi:hypothetical protein